VKSGALARAWASSGTVLSGLRGSPPVARAQAAGAATLARRRRTDQFCIWYAAIALVGMPLRPWLCARLWAESIGVARCGLGAGPL